MGTKRRAGDSSSPDENEKAARIREVIFDAIRKREMGAGEDDAEIERRHPELMPELGEQLRTLRAINAAAQSAEEGTATDSPTADDKETVDEDLLFLREALADYEILERVDYGGQGVVYKAIQRATQRPVAIKVLLDGPLASERQRQRLAREAELISRLNHPNIITLYESGFVRGRPFFTMEYVDGVPIDDYVLLHSLPPREIVSLFITVCGAVSHAHQQGVIHRDLNPSNILVSLEGVPHILDFGLAKDAWATMTRPDGSHLTVSGQVVGTLPFLSPEQAGGGDGIVDVRSDIYSLAVVLFLLLTEAFPYPIGGSLADARTNIVGREPASLRKVLSPERSAGTSHAVISDLEVILRKALAKDKADRYQSAAAFALDLERCLAGDPVEARAGSRLYLLRRTLRKYRAVAVIAAMFLLLGGAWAVSVSMLWLEARHQRDTARTTAQLAFATLDDVINTVDDAIAPLAGGMDARNWLLKGVVAERLKTIRPLVESDDAMRTLRAALYEKLGDIAYAEGRHADAARSYTDSLDLRMATTSMETATVAQLLEVARAHRKLAQVSDEAEAHFEDAIGIGREAVARDSQDADAQYALCESLVEYGRHLYLIGRYDEAAERIDDALATATAADDERWQTLLAKAYEWDGDIHIKLGHGERSTQSLSESLRVRQELSAAKPADATRRHNVLIAGLKLGRILISDGRSDEAGDTLRAAVSVGAYLVEIDPSVAVWQRDLFAAHYYLAQVYLTEQDLERARAACDAAVSLAQQLVERERDNAEWQVTLAYAHVLRGQISLQTDEPGPARDDMRAAMEIRERLSASDPDNLTLLGQLEVSCTWVGYCSRLLGDAESTLEHYRRAHEIANALATRQPSVVQRSLDLVRTQTNLAIGHIECGTPEHDALALDLLHEASASLEALHSSGKLAGHAAAYRQTSDEIRRWLERVNVTQTQPAPPSAGP